MKKILILLMLVFTTLTIAAEGPKPIKFEKDNFFAITQPFNGKLLDDFTEKVLSYDKEELYIYLDTPGGSVIALSRMARLMKSSKIKFTCVANFAASAGFMLFQHCQNRYILSDGIIMSHNWAGTFRGEAPRILSLFSAIQSLIDDLEAVAISKMNVDAKEYARLINNNLWMPAGLATKYDAVDAVISDVSCSKELVKKRVRTAYTSRSFFGSSTSYIYKSGCPLIQKAYVKSKDKKSDEYIGLRSDLFTLAQKNYVLEKANWIYTGSK